MPWPWADTGIACPNAAKTTSVIRLDVSVFPATTAAGGSALTRHPSGARTVTGHESAAGRLEVGRGEAANDVEARRARDGERAVEVAVDLGVSACEVDLDRVAGDRDGCPDLDQPVPPLELIRSLVAAVRELPQRRSHDALRVREQRVHRRGDPIATSAGAQLLDALVREPVRGELRAQVSPALVRVPHLRDEPVDGRVVETRGRDHDALVLEHPRVGREASRFRASHVGVVGACHREAERCPRDDRQVGKVGAAGVRVVEDPRLARRGVVRTNRRDRLGHRAEVDGDVLRLRDHPPVGVEERGRAVTALLDVRREGRAHEDRAHLLGDRAQRAPDHLQLDGDHPAAPEDERAVRIGLPSPALGHPGRGSFELERVWAGDGEGGAGDVHRWRGRDVRGANRDELERPLRIGVAVALRMSRMEARREIGAERDGQLEGLALVPEIGLAHGRQLTRLGERADVRAHVLAALVRRHETERGQHSGGGGDEHGAHSELLGERARVQRAGASERDEREVAWIEALLDGDDAESTHHLGVDDLDDGCRVEVAERPRGRVPIESDPAREARWKPIQKEVGVRHRRTSPAVPVARRPGTRTCALGPDSQRASSVAPGDGAAAGSDRVHGERGKPHREAADGALVLAARLTVRRSRRRRSRCRPCRRRARSRRRRAVRSARPRPRLPPDRREARTRHGRPLPPRLRGHRRSA